MLGWTLGYDLASVTAGPLATSLNQLYKHEVSLLYCNLHAVSDAAFDAVLHVIPC